jgi:iron(III) transport system substrate-binding protein
MFEGGWRRFAGRTLVACVLAGGAIATVRAEPMADRLEQARREGVVVVYAATDLDVVKPVVDDFEALHPGIRVEYHDMHSAELYARVMDEAGRGALAADVVWSSAMDLQVKLVNDGHAQPHSSAETAALPNWAIWKDEAFGTTYEPAAIVYNKRLLPAEKVPDTHAALIALIDEQPAQLRGRIATYDPERSGLGLLLHSQDAQANPIVFWQLARGMGQLGLEQHASSSDMLDRVAAGKLVLAYNVLGSYASKHAQRDPVLGVIWPRDYTLVLSRVAFITRAARHPAAARLWLDHLLSTRGQALLASHLGLLPVRGDAGTAGADSAAALLHQNLQHAFRPIRIGSGLLAYQDQAKKQGFLRQWEAETRPLP